MHFSLKILLTYLGLMKAFDFLSSLFIYDMEALIAQLKGCLLNCKSKRLLTEMSVKNKAYSDYEHISILYANMLESTLSCGG